MNDQQTPIQTWFITGFTPDIDQGVCQIEADYAAPVNKLFPDRQDHQALIWHYETRLTLPAPVTVEFPRLSPLCQVHCNDVVLGSANNAFHPHRFALPDSESGQYHIRLVFNAIDAFLAQRQPRPTWKTALANNNLRSLRTGLLGAIPGWANDGIAIGVLDNPVVIAETNLCHRVSIVPEFRNNEAQLKVASLVAELAVKQVTVRHQGQVLAQENLSDTVTTTISLGPLAPWWPHTHGKPIRHLLDIEIVTSAGTLTITKTLGFKSVELSSLQSPTFHINQEPTFLRGACWTSSDYPEHGFNEAKTRQVLEQARHIGFNVIRISGPMPYEVETFYDICDELGLLVWQDFSFANFDYPNDAEFLDNVMTETAYQVQRLSGHVSLLTFCGNSEVEQQGAMAGAALDQLAHSLFHQHLPEQVASLASAIPYVPSSPFGGIVPFQTDQGFSHYFGYGAYLQPESDLVLADVKFASECLGLSHVPEETFCKHHFQSPNPAPHLPKWKNGVSRDAATGWDFEDIRDHYLGEYFQVNVADLRARDLERYHQYSRVLTGYMMTRAYNYWRSSTSACSGAISWWLNDLKPGAGWGIIDSDGQPKPAAHILARQLQPLHVGLLNQGLNGMAVSLINERRESVCANLTVMCLHSGRNTQMAESLTLTLAPQSNQVMSLNQLFNRFIDSTNRYRFGAQSFDVIAVALEFDGETVTDAAFPSGLNLPTHFNPESLTLEGHLNVRDGHSELNITANQVVSFADVQVRKHRVWNNYQTLLPGIPACFRLEGPVQGDLNIVVSGLNLAFRSRLNIPGADHE
ncbi:hypothetical protein [Reinekea blandensis]|uniref:Glycosyl hydrolase family protein n=1 Tax=Reinekea blandensis MED297 TaxID=314283 RepID=A4B960_9GAMM|nr:hypothetical protein [Reinekea blandensis]EAR11161.1 glycosyl hydrolase family protein [Reinekea sp. MED297] [Reinekea blandensis MED297]